MNLFSIILDGKLKREFRKENTSLDVKNNRDFMNSYFKYYLNFLSLKYCSALMTQASSNLLLS